MRTPSARYQRIIGATGLSEAELDRQSVYVVEAFDILAQRIRALKAKLAASEGIKPLGRHEAFSTVGVGVEVLGLGTYMFPAESRVRFRTKDGFGWTVYHRADDTTEQLRINGPRFHIVPNAANDITCVSVE